MTRVLSSAALNSLRQRFGDGSNPPAACPPAEVPPSSSLIPAAAPEGGVDISDVPPLSAPAHEAVNVAPHDVPLHPGLWKDFEPVHKLGEGGYAVVLQVRERSSGRVCVIKKIHNAFATAEDAQVRPRAPRLLLAFLPPRNLLS